MVPILAHGVAAWLRSGYSARRRVRSRGVWDRAHAVQPMGIAVGKGADTDERRQAGHPFAVPSHDGAARARGATRGASIGTECDRV
ncbi:hypothetical protein SGFS_036320 [Streptomyces graminofaciens]|uniref:Uncharacterized protein n=1 Tax=Streptomyces graminofaciens TaxID=68212 RepID=A0ABM7F8N8_9ACTN|nr:hypothetical protein SGFS_036320 [Streptomyces graminofaciens]